MSCVLPHQVFCPKVGRTDLNLLPMVLAQIFQGCRGLIPPWDEQISFLQKKILPTMADRGGYRSPLGSREHTPGHGLRSPTPARRIFCTLS